MANELRYVRGDATAPAIAGPKIIAHVCNWGKGFVLAVSRRWPEPEAVYRAAFASAQPPVLGDVQFVAVSGEIEIANMIGQHGVARRGSREPPPIRYAALAQALNTVGERAKQRVASVHMPRIGAGLSGGAWQQIERVAPYSIMLRSTKRKRMPAWTLRP